MRHDRGDIQRVVDRTVCPGVENRQEQTGENPEARPVQMVGKLVPQNEDRDNMDQIEEQFDPVNMVVCIIHIHVMARSPPEKIVQCHTLILFCIAVAASINAVTANPKNANAPSALISHHFGQQVIR